ncbi:MAG: class I SAM-dependent methyltransferase [Rhodospirillales bacterium]
MNDRRDLFDAALIPGMRDRLAEAYAQFRASEADLIAALAPASKKNEAVAYRDRDCPCCGTASSNLVPVLASHGLDLLTCPGCGLTYSKQTMHMATDANRYRASSLDIAAMRLRCSGPYLELESARDRYYLDCLESARNGVAPTLLEIGCGTGTLLAEASARGWQCVGLEPGAAAVAVARERGAGIAIEGYFPQDLPPEPDRYDAIAMLDVLEHFASPLDVLRQVHPLLTPKTGRLFVQVPNWDSPLVRLEGPASSIVVPGHWSYFTPASLPMLMARAHFRLEHIETVVSECDRIAAFPLDAIERCITALRPGITMPEALPTAAWLHAHGLGYKLIATFVPLDG